MLRKISPGLIGVGMLLCTSIMAQTHDLMPGLGKEFRFEPQITEILYNPFSFALNADCTAQTMDDSDEIEFRVLNSSVAVNGVVIRKDKDDEQSKIVITVRNHDRLLLTAYSAAKVEITNKGTNALVLSCKMI